MTQQQMNIGTTGAALDRMKEIYPEFDVFQLEDDVTHIFTDVYQAYLNADLDYVDKVCSGEALGYFQASIKSWEELQVEPLSKQIWFLHSVDFQSRLEFDSRSVTYKQFPFLPVYCQNAGSRLPGQHEGGRPRNSGHCFW